FWGHVEDTCAVVRAAHPRIGNTYHVPHTSLEQFLRNREVAPLRHTRSAFRTRIAQHQHTIGINVEGRIIDSRIHLVVAVEDDCLNRNPPLGTCHWAADSPTPALCSTVHQSHRGPA